MSCSSPSARKERRSVNWSAFMGRARRGCGTDRAHICKARVLEKRAVVIPDDKIFRKGELFLPVAGQAPVCSPGRVARGRGANSADAFPVDGAGGWLKEPFLQASSRTMPVYDRPFMGSSCAMSSCCSLQPTPTRRMTVASLGKMPTTSQSEEEPV